MSDRSNRVFSLCDGRNSEQPTQRQAPVEWVTSAQEFSALLTAVQRLIYKLKASTLTFGGGIQTLSAQEKRNLAMQLVVSLPEPLRVDLCLRHASDEESELARMACAVMSAFETERVFEQEGDGPTLELLSACHPEVLELFKHGLVGAFHASTGLRVSLGNRSPQDTNDRLVAYCRGLFKKRFLGESLELTVNGHRVTVRDQLLTADLRPGVRWQLRMDAQQAASFKWHLRDQPTATLALIGRPELVFGASNKTVSVFQVDQFTLTDSTTSHLHS